MWQLRWWEHKICLFSWKVSFLPQKLVEWLDYLAEGWEQGPCPLLDLQGCPSDCRPLAACWGGPQPFSDTWMDAGPRRHPTGFVLMRQLVGGLPQAKLCQLARLRETDERAASPKGCPEHPRRWVRRPSQSRRQGPRVCSPERLSVLIFTFKLLTEEVRASWRTARQVSAGVSHFTGLPSCFAGSRSEPSHCALWEAPSR